MDIKLMDTIEASDAELVAKSLAGSREAFGWIVARYQSLICALNYSATGNLSQSEDLAQETFLTAWKQLGRLREPAKLRPWLCQISRNLAFDALKKQGREPSHGGEALDTISESQSPEPSPMERAISKEEQEILWRAIERIPDLYREPLVLFYREHRSIEAVALSLELSEDVVKQRLFRGRKLLSQQVTAFVEGALEQTNPGKVFTIGVMASLPSVTLSSKAAMLGAAAAKGAGTVKAATAAGSLGALLPPLLGFYSIWLGYRTSADSSYSEREQTFNRHFFMRLIGVITAFFLAYLILVFFFKSLVTEHHAVFAGLMAGLVLAYVIAVAAISVECYKRRVRLLSDLTPEERAAISAKPAWEYRSRLKLLGVPLVHFRIGDRLAPPLVAWIAGGDCVFGILFGFGGLAIAPVSIGGFAVGLISWGGLSIGALSIGGCALGAWAYGGVALGWQAFGGCAIAWSAAWGGYAIAHQFALGGLVHAVEANNAAAGEFIQSKPFFRISGMSLPYLLWLNLVWFIPLVILQGIVKRLVRKQNTTA